MLVLQFNGYIVSVKFQTKIHLSASQDQMSSSIKELNSHSFMSPTLVV